MSNISKKKLMIGLMLAGWLTQAQSSPLKNEDSSVSTVNAPLSQLITEKSNIISSSLFDFSNNTDNRVSMRSVPLPAAILLFGPAMVCLMGLKTRRK